MNPFTAPACNISGLKVHTCTSANSIFDGPVTNLLSILCILVEILSRAHAKGAKSLNDFKIGTFLLVVFGMTVQQAWQ